MVPPDRRRRRGIRALLALGLVGSLLASCSGDDPDDGRADDSVAVASASAVASDPPVVAGPRPKTAFDYIRELEIRPGSVDDFLIRDLLAVADSAQAHIAARGRMGTLDEVKAIQDYRLRGGKVVLVSGAGTPASFCLRAFVKDDDPRVWFYDTDRVLPRGGSCG